MPDLPMPVPLSGLQPQPSLRTSLRAATLDGVLAAIFSNLTGGVLLSNFLVQLQVSTVVIGLVTAAPPLMNLLQPLGAHLVQRSRSRYRYGLWVFGCSRLLWLMLALGIISGSWQHRAPQGLVWVAVGVILAAEILAALGSASWLSWMAALIPSRLRGRYFGFRNSVVNLTVLVCVPLAGWGVAHWPGGGLPGYGVMLLLGVTAGLLSLWVQSWIRDFNPQANGAVTVPSPVPISVPISMPATPDPSSPWQSRSVFLLYWGLWTLGMNLSAPYFNLYLLSELRVDLSWVTGYNSLMAGATLLSLIFWGRLADRLGNRPLLLGIGVPVALTPLLWLGMSNNPLSLHLWLPLLFVLTGSTVPAMELWSNNLQITLAPALHQTQFFALVAAVGGLCGALGIFLGGCIVQFCQLESLTGIFALSSLIRLLALTPLLFVQEPHSFSPAQSLKHYLGKHHLGKPLGWTPPPPAPEIPEIIIEEAPPPTPTLCQPILSLPILSLPLLTKQP